MSRFSMGCVCALLALTGLTFSGYLGAQEEKDTYGLDTSAAARQSRAEEVDAEERIERIIDQRLKAEFITDGRLLNELIEQIVEEYEIPIQFDTAALDEIVVSPEIEVNMAPLRNLSLRSALNLVFRQPGLEELTYVVEDEVLLITTEERANETTKVIIYRVDDFELSREIPNPGGGGGGFVGAKPTVFSPLTQVITSCVEHDSWKINGTGEGELYLLDPGMLVVTQTRQVHQQIEKLLDQLREVKAEIENGSNSGSY